MRNPGPLSILFLTLATCCIYSCSNERVPETFLIGKDFRGDFYIIYNQKRAQKEKFEGDARVYEIPGSGVLFTEFEPDWRGMTYHNGRTSQRFYKVDKNGNRIEIPAGDTFEFERSENPITDRNARNKVSVFFIGAGTMGFENNFFTFDEYFIGPYDEIGKTKRLKPEYIDSLKIQQVKL